MKQKVVQLMKLAALSCLTALLTVLPAFAQGGRITVNGTVIDADGLPVIGAGVTLKGTTTGVAADADGKFTLTVPGETAVLEVSALGYVTQDIRVGKQRTLVVTLQDDTQALEATVVVAYGTQTKATVTGALTSIDSKALIKAPVADVTNVLAGQMPGVSTVQESGQPGDDYAKIYIRGVSSLNESASTPLILVDGIERPLNTVDPNEIESLSVLKDAASTAVFGVRGANGVIIVTTKRGDAGKPKISASSITGVQVPLAYVTQVSSYDFARYFNVWKWNDGFSDYFSNEAIEAYRTGSDPLMYPDVRMNEMMFRKAFLQTKNNINISGGSDKVRYFVSMGYMYQNGLLKQMPDLSYDNNYKYNRYNYRANLDFKLTETTDMKFNISGVIGDQHEPIATQSDIWLKTLIWTPPVSSPGIINGYPYTTVEDKVLPALTTWNAYEYLYDTGYTDKYKTTLGIDMTITQRLDFITEGLSVGIKGSYDTSMSITKKHTGGGPIHQTITYASWLNSTMDPTDPDFDRTIVYTLGSGVRTPLSYSESQDDDKSWYLEGRVDYSRKFARKHAVSGLLLYNQSRDYYPSKFTWLPRGYVGFVGRATYGYMDKYLVDVSAGYNGSENFAPGKTRYGFFPSISLGWVISEEPWMKKVPWIDYLKIRGSIGKVGNDIGDNRFMYMEGTWNDAGSYYFGNTDSGGVPRYEQGTIGNSNVTWETSVKSNVGLDFEFFNRRLHFSGDLFHEYRSGILVSPTSLPTIIAINLPNMNLGEVENNGYEIELGWRDHIGDFTYDLNANVTFARNKIINMDEVEPLYEYQKQTGGSTHRHKMYEYVRLYQKSDFYIDENGVQRLNPDLPQPNQTVYPGDAMYADLNGDHIIDGNDWRYDGYPDRPEFVFGSNWKFGYKGFNLTLNWVGATNVNRKLFSDYYVPFTSSSHGRGLLQYLADNCWIDNDNPWVPGREDGTLPRFTHTNYEWNSYLSSLTVKDASYIRLKSASFGYTFSRGRFLDYLGIRALSLMFTGYNLLTFSPMTLQDPEALSYTTKGSYPLVKTYNLALNVTF